jgi:hypothetical protein
MCFKELTPGFVPGCACRRKPSSTRRVWDAAMVPLTACDARRGCCSRAGADALHRDGREVDACMSWMGLFVWEALTGHKPHLRGFGYFPQISSENSQKNRKNVQLGVRLLAGVRGMTGRIFFIN